MTLPVVTVFGGSGFIGRHLVQALARNGCTVRVATRDPERAAIVKTAGTVGQIVPIRCSPWDAASVAGVITGADAVINLIGIAYQRGKDTFERSHIITPGLIARICTQAGVRNFVHVSALGADVNSGSAYARSKAAGESAVRAGFPDAIILRPSIVFGPEDSFFNRFASMALWSPFLPLIGGGTTKFQPVYVGDVVQAIMTVLDNPVTRGHVYELGGPAVYTFRQLLAYTMHETGRRRFLCPLSFEATNTLAAILEILPNPMLTRDQVMLLRRDNTVGGRAEGLENLGMTPTAMEAIVPAYLAAYRAGGRFAEIAAA